MFNEKKKEQKIKWSKLDMYIPPNETTNLMIIIKFLSTINENVQRKKSLACECAEFAALGRRNKRFDLTVNHIFPRKNEFNPN